MNELEKPYVVVLAEKSVPYTLHDSFWIPCSAKFITLGASATSSGVIQIHEIVDGKIELFKEIACDKSLKRGTFGASSLRNRHLATGDFFGNLNIWDIEHSSVPIYSVQGHKEIIMSIDGVGGTSVGCGAPEIVTGSQDGYVKVWDPRQKDKPVAIMEATDAVARHCWAVTFGNSFNSQERVVCAGYDNGDVKMFDLRTMSLKYEVNLKSGVCFLEFDRKDIRMNKFVATGLEGMVCLFETRNRHSDFPYISKSVHNSTVWCGKHLPQNRDIFVTCAGSGSLSLWKYSYCNDEMGAEYDGSLQQIQKTNVSTQGVPSFDWCPDKIGLAVCSSFDQTIRLLYVSKLQLQ